MRNIHNLPLPKNFDSYDETLKNQILSYLNQLNTVEQKAYTLGYEHLGTSFHVIKSNGFQDWLKQK
jgi:hypothetical protein